jgi:hypothetical protein
MVLNTECIRKALIRRAKKVTKESFYREFCNQEAYAKWPRRFKNIALSEMLHVVAHTGVPF